MILHVRCTWFPCSVPPRLCTDQPQLHGNLIFLAAIKTTSHCVPHPAQLCRSAQAIDTALQRLVCECVCPLLYQRERREQPCPLLAKTIYNRATRRICEQHPQLKLYKVTLLRHGLSEQRPYASATRRHPKRFVPYVTRTYFRQLKITKNRTHPTVRSE